MPGTLELQYELESKAVKWYATIFSIALTTECRPQFTFIKRNAVHLKLTAPGVKAQSYHLPWSNPSYTRKG